MKKHTSLIQHDNLGCSILGREMPFYDHLPGAMMMDVRGGLQRPKGKIGKNSVKVPLHPMTPKRMMKVLDLIMDTSEKERSALVVTSSFATGSRSSRGNRIGLMTMS